MRASREKTAAGTGVDLRALARLLVGRRLKAHGLLGHGGGDKKRHQWEKNHKRQKRAANDALCRTPVRAR